MQDRKELWRRLHLRRRLTFFFFGSYYTRTFVQFNEILVGMTDDSSRDAILRDGNHHDKWMKWFMFSTARSVLKWSCHLRNFHAYSDNKHDRKIFP